MATLEELKTGDVVVAVEPVHADYVYDDQKIKPRQIGLVLQKEKDRSILIVKDGTRKYVKDGSVFRRTRKATREQFFNDLNRGNVEFIRSNDRPSGCDPEVFAIRGDGSLLPAFQYLPHKDKAEEVKCNEEDGPGKIRTFYDGFQAEFVTSPNRCHSWLVDYVWAGLKSVYDAARKCDPAATLTHKSVMDVPREMMALAPKDGVDMGCAPSNNAYDTEAPMLGKMLPEDVPFRFAGVHFHCGQKCSKEVDIQRIKTMDAFVGVASVAALRGLEDDRRRKFYGLAGEYRRPGHGLEYRVLSSAAIVHPAVTHLFFDMLRTANIAGQHGLRSLYHATDDEVQDCINNYDVDAAVKLVKKNHCLYKSMLSSIYSYGRGGDVVNNAMSMIIDGVANLLPTESIVKNWMLDGERKNRDYRGTEHWATHSENDNCCMHTLKL
jgi:hypothetical protein